MLSLQDRIDDAASDEMAFFNQKRMHQRLANQLQAQSDAATDVVDREKFRRAADEQRKRYSAAARNEWRATLKLRELMDQERGDVETMRAYGSLTVDMRSAA
jgi:hypothetical protein